MSSQCTLSGGLEEAGISKMVSVGIGVGTGIGVKVGVALAAGVGIDLCGRGSNTVSSAEVQEIGIISNTAIDGITKPATILG